MYSCDVVADRLTGRSVVTVTGRSEGASGFINKEPSLRPLNLCSTCAALHGPESILPLISLFIDIPRVVLHLPPCHPNLSFHQTFVNFIPSLFALRSSPLAVPSCCASITTGVFLRIHAQRPATVTPISFVLAASSLRGLLHIVLSQECLKRGLSDRHY